MRRIALDDDAGLVVHEAVEMQAALIVLPGGRCAARRYGWLAPLATQGIAVCVLDGALPTPVEREGPSPAILQLAAAIGILGAWGVPVHGVGHSAGAAALLDALEPAANPAAGLSAEFALPVPLASVTSLGCSLQPRALDWVLPHRSEDRPLWRPAETKLLFLAGVDDAVAPPALVVRTCARYTPPAPMIAMRQATHYGWAGPREDGDAVASDRDVSLCTVGQRARSLEYLSAFVTGRDLLPAPGDRLVAADN